MKHHTLSTWYPLAWQPHLRHHHSRHHHHIRRPFDIRTTSSPSNRSRPTGATTHQTPPVRPTTTIWRSCHWLRPSSHSTSRCPPWSWRWIGIAEHPPRRARSTRCATITTSSSCWSARSVRSPSRTPKCWSVTWAHMPAIPRAARRGISCHPVPAGAPHPPPATSPCDLLKPMCQRNDVAFRWVLGQQLIPLINPNLLKYDFNS